MVFLFVLMRRHCASAKRPSNSNPNSNLVQVYVRHAKQIWQTGFQGVVQVQPLTFETFNHPESLDESHKHLVIDHIYDERSSF